MQYIPYNSRKSYHKTPFGAVAEGTEIVFRVILPRETGAKAVRLMAAHDGSQEYAALPMRWERMEGPGEEWWTVRFAPSGPGLLFYHFEFDSANGLNRISNDGAGLGRICDAAKDWQLTVYSPDFKTPDWIKGGIIYQIFPDRFCRPAGAENAPSGEAGGGLLLRSDWGGEPLWEPDEKGDITRYDFFGGTLKGIAEKLGYLAELHVSCIYLNPVFEAHSNHRYDTADYSKIDPLLGSEEDFRELCSLALKKGIRVILDGVFSHTGADSIYFNKNRRYPLQGAYNTQQSPYYKWYTFRRWPDDYKCWWGIDILPEINENEPGFKEFITGENGIARKWLKAGASGWRLDVADELPDGFLDNFRKAVKSENPDAYILGEVWEDASVKCSYGKRRRYLGGSQLDSVMNYPFANALLDFALTGQAETLMDILLDILENYPPESIHTLMNHIGTHDTVRAVTRLATGADDGSLGPGRKAAPLNPQQREKGLALMKFISAVQFTLPGVPCIYYGDEAGLEGGRDPFNRGCYPWGAQDKQLLEHYRLLGKIRKNCAALIDGDFEAVSACNGCIAFARSGRNERLLTAANSGSKEAAVPLPEEWRSSEILLGNARFCTGSLVIPAAGAVILAPQGGA